MAGTAADRIADRDPPASSLPSLIGNHEILREIARGGMGVVYEARQIGLNRIVALKLTLAGQFAGEDERQRFRGEAEIAAQLDHPHIVPVYEVGEHQGQPYFSMAFVEGQSLKDMLVSGPLPPRKAAELMVTVCEAVEYAHSRGIVHRDLKPHNVLLSRSGQIRVSDFGLAKRLSVDRGLTASGQVLGTPGFLPPEQVTGDLDNIGPRSDVYSLGATLYALLTGRPPFMAASVMETLMQTLRTPPVPPRQLNPSIPEELERICLRGLEKPPSLRFASAQEVADALRTFLNRASGSLSPAAERRTLGAWIMCGLFATALATGIGLWMSREIRDPRLPSVPAPAAGSQIAGVPSISGAKAHKSTSPVGSTAALRIESFRLRHYRGNGDKSEPAGEIGIDSQQAWENDGVRISAKFDRPAYSYLIAFNPDGQIQLCVPADPLQVPHAQSSLEFPPDQSEMFYFTDGSGQQAFALLASTDPLPTFAAWRQTVGALPWHSLAPGTVYMLDGSDRSLENIERPRGVIGPIKGQDAIVALDTFLRALNRIEIVQTVGFPVLPTP